MSVGKKLIGYFITLVGYLAARYSLSDYLREIGVNPIIIDMVGIILLLIIIGEYIINKRKGKLLMDGKRSIAIIHSSKYKISKKQISDCLKTYTPNVSEVENYEIDLEKFNLYDPIKENWEKALEYQNKRFQKLKDNITDTISLHYFGNPNVSLILQLGYLFSLRQVVELYQHIRNLGKNYWGWGKKSKPKSWKLNQIMINEQNSNIDDIAIVISQSVKISEEDVAAVVGMKTLQVHIVVPNPSIHDLVSVKQVDEFQKTIQETLSNYTNVNLIHLFIATGPPVAFRIGQSISNTMHPTFQLYEFQANQAPKYRKSIKIN